ncbi:MAG: type II secretion system protein [Gemmatimonadales bacterium]
MRHDNRGFTLIELLMVVVIIGILAAIAIPKFRTTKEEAYTSKMKGDLRNLATAQEAYTSDNGVYYNGPIPAPALVYNPSQGVTLALANVTATGWGATAASPGLTARTCAIYFGTGGPLGPATAEGRVACTP